jgi:hypothetical protein
MAITISDEGGVVMGEAPENHAPNLTTSVGVTHLTAISALLSQHDGIVRQVNNGGSSLDLNLD